MDEIRIINRFPDWRAPDFNIRRWNSQFSNSNVIINSDVYEADYPVHWGPLSLKFAFKGAEYYETDNCRYRVSDGKFLLMNEDQLYSSSILPSETANSFSLSFSPEYKRKRLAELLLDEDIILDEPDREAGENMNFFSRLYLYDKALMDEVMRLKNNLDKLNYGSLYINERLSNILRLILLMNMSNYREADKVNSSKRSTRLEIFKRLTRAKDHIESNYSGYVSLEILGKVSYMNPHHFLRKFKDFFGETPHQYLTNVRLSNAEGMLRKDENSITDICMSVGFEDPCSFSKLFRREYGYSPEKYRREVRKSFNLP